MIRTFFSTCLCFCLILCSLIVETEIMGTNVFAASPEPAKYTVGKATIWALADSVIDRNMAVYPDVDAAILQKYAPQGHLPSAIMVFVVQFEGQVLLIDTGLGKSSQDEKASQLMTGLAKIGVKAEEVNMVLLTHMHGDHIGGLMRDGGKAFPKAQILCSRVEYNFWLDEQSVLNFPKNKANFTLANQIMALYGEMVRFFDFDETLLPGLTALDARGHTPGHTAFLLQSEGEQLLFWGDMLHAAGLQFPHPEINATYDMDPAMAAATRIRFLEMVTQAKNLSIAGAHLPFPAIAQVKKTGATSYSYSPIF